MSFGDSVFSAGFIQKTIKGDLLVKKNYRIPPRKQRGKIPAGASPPKQTPRGCHVGPAGPTYRPAGLWVPPVSLRFESRFLTAIEIQSSPFI